MAPLVEGVLVEESGLAGQALQSVGQASRSVSAGQASQLASVGQASQLVEQVSRSGLAGQVFRLALASVPVSAFQSAAAEQAFRLALVPVPELQPALVVQAFRSASVPVPELQLALVVQAFRLASRLELAFRLLLGPGLELPKEQPLHYSKGLSGLPVSNPVEVFPGLVFRLARSPSRLALR